MAVGSYFVTFVPDIASGARRFVRRFSRRRNEPAQQVKRNYTNTGQRTYQQAAQVGWKKQNETLTLYQAGITGNAQWDQEKAESSPEVNFPVWLSRSQD
jgi:hypothetical protein